MRFLKVAALVGVLAFIPACSTTGVSGSSGVASTATAVLGNLEHCYRKYTKTPGFPPMVSVEIRCSPKPFEASEGTPAVTQSWPQDF